MTGEQLPCCLQVLEMFEEVYRHLKSWLEVPQLILSDPWETSHVLS